MKRYIIDTNVLISFVTDRNPGQQEVVASLFEQATTAKVSILCPQNVLVEFVYVMEKIYRQPKELIRQMITDFIAMPGMAIVDDVPFGEVLALWPDPFGDLGDALAAAVALRVGKAELVTFDSDFRGGGGDANLSPAVDRTGRKTQQRCHPTEKAQGQGIQPPQPALSEPGRKPP